MTLQQTAAMACSHVLIGSQWLIHESVLPIPSWHAQDGRAVAQSCWCLAVMTLPCSGSRP